MDACFPFFIFICFVIAGGRGVWSRLSSCLTLVGIVAVDPIKMKPYAFAVLLCIASLNCAHAQNDVYVCSDENGVKEYKNTGAGKGCKKLELPGLSSTPPARRKAPAAVGEGNAAAASFPKVNGATQKARDSERKRILQDELTSEEKKLAGLKADFNNGEPERRGDERNYAKYQQRVADTKDDIARSERNIAALKRELSKLP